jgi:hypothetical protein
MTLPLPTPRFRRLVSRAWLLALALAAVAACAAPTPSARGDTPTTRAQDGPKAGDTGAGQSTPPAATPATPAMPAAPAATPAGKKWQTGGPLPPERIDGQEKGAPEVRIDASCRTDADCTVKNVGNCCGQYPACVNVNSPTDPKGVQERCAKQGMSSVCGFREISSCACVKGTCEDSGSGALEVER